MLAILTLQSVNHIWCASTLWRLSMRMIRVILRQGFGVLMLAFPVHGDRCGTLPTPSPPRASHMTIARPQHHNKCSKHDIRRRAQSQRGKTAQSSRVGTQSRQEFLFVQQGKEQKKQSGWAVHHDFDVVR
jgi:hypothetical protein